jgi:hypothetical protein
VAADTVMLHGAEDALAALQRTATTNATAYTWLPKLGQVIHEGEPVYAADGDPVVLLYGNVPLYRDLSNGVPDGADVAEITDDLIKLGFGAGMSESSHFSPATAAALARWEAALGQPATGTLSIGQAFVEPGPIRVSAITATLGAPIGGGANTAVLTATSLTRVVTVALAVGKQSLVHPGDVVSIVLPDQSTTPGHVRDVSTVAVAPSDNNAQSTPTVSVTVTIDHPDATGKLDQAPVNVNIADASVHDVLAVPINALLALAGGGDAVEVVANGTKHLVGVQTGVFGDTLVEISGGGVVEGTTVEVPAS